ncbi:Hypothetical predicted protein [Paramuricea clavata]|uniref:Uncharacterized protein n=1 Tax=Paramuricea clavata TaxID=317549 RepID=A0A6S7INB0_PARCT|nr:Hypothetical predicted protein [Paramuricea clavata]
MVVKFDYHHKVILWVPKASRNYFASPKCRHRVSDSDTEQQDVDLSNDIDDQIKWLRKAKGSWIVSRESNIDEKNLTLNPKFSDTVTKNSRPIEFFGLFVTSELLEMILHQTKLYATTQAINNSNGI